MIGAPALSDDEREHWNTHGFLLLRNCLSDAEIETLTASMSDLATGLPSWSEEKKLAHTSTAGNGKHIDIIGLPFLTEAVHSLMDHPNVFGRILSLMGPFIYVPGMEYLERYSHGEQLLRMHTDGGGGLRSIFPSAESLVLQLKVQFFLTDLDEADSGNFLLVPGSHRKRFPVDSTVIDQAARDAVPVLAKKGDVLIFPWSLWHGVAANRSTNTRKSIIARYAQLWMRPVEYERASDAFCDGLAPRTRRLLANLPECRSQNDYYRPNMDLQVNTMFGEEWQDHPELYLYNGMKKPIKELFDQ